MMEITFLQAIAGTILPHRADPSAGGTLPQHACWSVRQSSGRGWYGYPPADFAFNWQGDHRLDVWIDGHHEEVAMGGAVQRPYDAEAWDLRAPKELYGELYPILSRSHLIPEMLQIWSGFLIDIPQGWAVEIRPVVNRPSTGYAVYAGLFTAPGPLFASLVLTQSNRSVVIPKDQPLFQLQPFPRESSPPTMTVRSFAEWTDAEWRNYHEHVVVPSRRRDESPAH
jgi:hypothetical protein